MIEIVRGRLQEREGYRRYGYAYTDRRQTDLGTAARCPTCMQSLLQGAHSSDCAGAHEFFGITLKKGFALREGEAEARSRKFET